GKLPAPDPDERIPAYQREARDEVRVGLGPEAELRRRGVEAAELAEDLEIAKGEPGLRRRLERVAHRREGARYETVVRVPRIHVARRRAVDAGHPGGSGAAVLAANYPDPTILQLFEGPEGPRIGRTIVHYDQLHGLFLSH